VEVYVHLVATIGEPVDSPWTGVQVVLPAGLGIEDIEGAIRDVVGTELGRMPTFCVELARGDYRIC
jgi:S-adenosylmethionine synthetase